MKPEVTAKLRIDYRKWRFLRTYECKSYFVIYTIFSLFIFPTNTVLLKMIVLQIYVKIC